MSAASVPAFALDAEQRQLVDEARRLGHRLAPIAHDGEAGRVNRPLVRALAEHRLLARLFPEDGEASALGLCLLREGLAHGSPEAETALALQGLGAYPILQSGRAATAERWIGPVAAGEAIAAFALSEPGAGTDAGALELRAERDGHGFRLTGTKTWISNAPDADIYTVFARTTPDARARGVTAFAVPGDADGLSGEPIRLLAPHPIGRLELDGVFVSEDDVLGEMDAGFRVAMATLDRFRPSVGALAVGMAQAALDAAKAYAAERHTFGCALREHQSVAHRLAEMAVRTEASRLLVYSAAAAHDRGERSTSRAAMAKFHATESAQWVVDAAIQIHGARAMEEGHLLAHLYREVRPPRIYEGASEIQLEIVGRELYR